jgi:hypothetical protein
MSYKSNTSNDLNAQTLRGDESPPDKEVSIHEAGFRKLRPVLRLSRNTLNEMWYTFQLTELQNIIKVHQIHGLVLDPKMKPHNQCRRSSQDHLWKR